MNGPEGGAGSEELQSGEEKGIPVSRSGEEILQVLRKGAEFTQELLKENERLRYQVVRLQEENISLTKESMEKGSSAELERLQKRLEQLESEKNQLIERFKEVEEENKDFANRYLEIENENNNLANLYIASYQLHSTLDFKEVLRIILEIVIKDRKSVV